MPVANDPTRIPSPRSTLRGILIGVFFTAGPWVELNKKHLTLGRLDLGCDIFKTALGYVLKRWGCNMKASLADVCPHGTGGIHRLTWRSVGFPGFLPQERHIAPNSRISLFSEISFSRTAREPVTTGPSQLSQR